MDSLRNVLDWLLGRPSLVLSSLEEALKGRLTISRALTVLKQLSLIYVGAHEWWPNEKALRVLSPIRRHIRQYHILDELWLMLIDAKILKYVLSPWHWNSILSFGMRRQGHVANAALNLSSRTRI